MSKLSKFLSLIFFAFLSTKSFAIHELVVWEDEKKAKGIEQAVADFEREFHCKVTVKEIPFVSQIDKLRLDGPSGSGPDVFMIPSDRIGSAVVQGLVAPIKFMDEDQDKYIASSVSAFTHNGEIYAVPKVVETLILIYNKSILRNPFDTLDEYFDYSKKRVNQGNNEYGLLVKWDLLYYVFSLMQPYGGYVFGLDKDGNLDADDVGLANDGAIEGVEIAKQFYDNSCFPDSILGEDGTYEQDNIFSSGKAAAVITGPWALDYYKSANIDYGVTPLPVLQNGKPMSSFLGVKGYAISTWANDYDLAEDFLKFINQPKYVKQRYLATNEIPPVKAVMIDPIITNNDVANAIAVQASRAIPTPSIPEMAEVWTPMNVSLRSIFEKKMSVRDALNTAVEQVHYQIDAFKSGL
ncbi:arabinogalactan oligomer / maltooligosaccharide transport system substrate-binding protein [Succinivibrio dextrinosolvens]|uniref:extracellular solute-binding protein n=1 Tax=Succinivibrio dextrinosolvens TaxID=83771 RepID=UPI0008EC93B8|nr:extracellular solute-binding protein [Succinivibrio dextrinosolvens]SFS51504.1 arabinogalactan oligomer / maltooligosaccharide transport system substrate-binding protein [Succinivibrio dextrinosolvens]